MSASTLAIPSDMQEWARQCPNPAFFARLIAERVILNRRVKCYECGAEECIRDLRVDVSYWESGELICKYCWFKYDEAGTIARPDFRAPPWPETFKLDDAHPPRKGKIIDPAVGVIGSVTDYRAGPHFGRVTLGDDIGMSEYGSLCPEWVVEEEEDMDESEYEPRNYQKIIQEVLASLAL